MGQRPAREPPFVRRLSMFTPFSLSSYVVSGIVAGLLASGVLDSSLGLVSVNQVVPHPQAIVETLLSHVADTINVQPSHKSDRLNITRTDSATNITVIVKNVGPTQHTLPVAGAPARLRALEIDDSEGAPTLMPAPLLHCEALVSAVSRPILNRFMGRCFV
jgi:hypothetical protein